MKDLDPEQGLEMSQLERDVHPRRAIKDAADDYFDDVQGYDNKYPTAARYLSSTEVARYLGLAGVKSLSKMKLPPPDAVIGDIRGWLPSTIQEWNASRPGPGRWGTRAETRSPVARTADPELMMITDDQASESLTEALAQARIPVANHEFIRHIAGAIGIAAYDTIATASKTYIRAKRRDGLQDLHIHYGYTNGFSEEEIERVAGSAARAPSSRAGTWYVRHPVNQVR